MVAFPESTVSPVQNGAANVRTDPHRGLTDLNLTLKGDGFDCNPTFSDAPSLYRDGAFSPAQHP